jgi:[acyl-carrier-protein] S-malonyltransferase
MGAELLEDPELRDLCARCAERAGIDLAELLTRAPDEELRLTQHAQPALCFTGIALARLLQRRGIVADALSGHSVGEYAALCVAGAVTPEDAVAAVHERGRAMAAASPPGESSMAAVLGLPPHEVEKVIEGVPDVWPANFNTPTQTVIAGRTQPLEEAGELLRQAGARKVMGLNVSAAFHTPLMAPAASALRRVLEAIEWRNPAASVVANLTAQPYRGAAEIPAQLELQLRSPVRWSDCVAELARQRCNTFIELGPKRALSGMMRELVPDATAVAVATPSACAELAVPA